MEQKPIYEYELLSIEFEQPYEKVALAREGGPGIEYDAEGIPTGNTPEEIKMRKQIIFQFYERWKNEHPRKAVFNKSIREDIFIRKESVVEASGHAPKRYLSTLAVLRLEEVLTNAVKVDEDDPKAGDKNQAKLTKMLLMAYRSPELGTIKLTVGVRRRSGDKVQYGITALKEDEEIKSIGKANAKKKAPHKK